MNSKDESIEARIAMWEDLSLYLFDLANTVPEHVDMLFRLSDEAKAEAEKLRKKMSSGAKGCCA